MGGKFFSSKSVSEVAEALNIGDGMLYAWVRKSQNASHLKLENDILKKAAVILGTNPQPRTAR
ncbi:hypothetical protein OAK97_01970 [bacterium]|nr:hypothetical protein [bacterium]